ncbi:bacterial transcription activator, effector binding protein [hydrocarbon metagenome]|uniref:Bacterial transcription activator, effector binding protein n=1 Tax=hydrocarbon metagenome TaxID=938273 RepID=A0A0W8FFC5_9ZZZZ
MDVAPQKVVGLRRAGRYEEIGPMLGEVMAYIQARGITVIGPPAFICHEQTPGDAQRANEAGNADLEVVFPIEGDAEGSGEIGVYELPGGRMARIIHMGPYRECEGAYSELFAWLAENKLTVTGPIREVYINDPHTTAEDLLVTWIYAPIE